MMKHEVISIALLDGHKRNYRSHPEPQIAQLKASLERFQQVRPIVVAPESNGRYTILAGHGVVGAALECGYTEMSCTVVPKEWDSVTRDAYLVADNLHSQGASDDDTMLAQLLQEQQDAGFDLASLGTDDETLRQMLEALGDAYLSDDESDEDEYIPEIEEEQTRVKLGDIWQLGRHKIGCLNSLDVEQVKRLFDGKAPDMVWADPPYGIDIVATNVSVGGGEAYDIPFGGVKNREKRLGSIGGAKPFGTVGRISYGMKAKPIIEQGKYHPVVGDDSPATAIAVYQLCAEFFPKAVHIWWGANNYANALPPSTCWIVWDKENGESFFADCELAWTNQKTAVRIFRHMWNGLMKASEKGQRRVHPTQKPVALAEWAFEKYGKEHDVIYDPFLGSGISVIAAENTDRTVFGCELSPAYINEVIKRWEKHTGQTAQLLERIEEAAHV
jgi:ParB-like chromosome segregation protein Spo0J